MNLHRDTMSWSCTADPDANCFLVSAVRRETGNRSGAPLAGGSAISWPNRSGGSTMAASHAPATASSPRCAERCTHRAAQAHLSVVLILTCSKAHVLQPAAQPHTCHFCHIRMPNAVKPAVWRCRRRQSCRCSRTASLRCAGCRQTCQRSSCRCCRSGVLICHRSCRAQLAKTAN